MRYGTIKHGLLNPKRKLFENPEAIINSLVGDSRLGHTADLGCGPGYYCAQLLKMSDELYCVDSNAEFLGIIKKRIKDKRVHIVNSSASSTGISEKSIDTVVMANSFHDMDFKDEVVAEIKKILKDGGRLLIIDWKKEESDFGPPFDIRMSKEKYLEFFKGFKLLKSEEFKYHIAMLLIK